MGDRGWRPTSAADDGRRNAIPRSESTTSTALDSQPASARSSLHPGAHREGRGGADDSYQPYEDADSYDPNQALLRAPNENFKVMTRKGDATDRELECACLRATAPLDARSVDVRRVFRQCCFNITFVTF